jgi:hypothetical protein
MGKASLELELDEVKGSQITTGMYFIDNEDGAICLKAEEDAINIGTGEEYEVEAEVSYKVIPKGRTITIKVE